MFKRTVETTLCGNGGFSLKISYWAEDAFGNQEKVCEEGFGCNGLPFSTCDFNTEVRADLFSTLFAKVVADMGVASNIISALTYHSTSKSIAITLLADARVVVIDPMGGAMWYNSGTLLTAGDRVIDTSHIAARVAVAIALDNAGVVVGASWVEIDPVDYIGTLSL